MQLPIHIGFGEMQMNPHLLFELLAFFLGFRYFIYLRSRQEDLISTEDRVWILIGAALGALIGSRLLGAMEHWPAFVSGGGEVGWLYYYQHKTIVGGLLGGLLVVEWTKYFLKVRTSSGDLFTFPIVLGMMIGRIGCFLSGIEDGTYGVETDFIMGMDLGDGLMRHPTALYEIIFLGSLWLSIRILENKITLSNGSRFKIFMVAYLLFRLLIENLKPGFRFEWGLTSIQMACVLGLIYYIKVWTRSGIFFGNEH